MYWEESKSVSEIYSETDKEVKQVPNWDPRQHVEGCGPFTEIESSRLDFQLSAHVTIRWDGTWMRHGNRVQWTRFPCIETEFIELGFYIQKSSSTHLVSMYRNQVHWTWFLCIETEFNELGFYTWKTSSLNSNSMSHPCPISPDDHVGTELEIEPTRLDFCKWSPALHVLSWVLAGDLFSLFVRLTI